MQFLNGCYSSYFNKRHGRVGHLFQGRFKALLIEKQGYYTEISRYIHLNPVRSHLVRKPEDWPWGSYAGYCSADRTLEWITYSAVLGEFGSSVTDPRDHYRQFIAEGLEASCTAPWEKAVEELILGSEQFVSEVSKHVAGRRPANALPQLKRLRERPTLAEIIYAVASALQADTTQWAPGRKIRDNSRALAAFIARRKFGYATTAVAKTLGYATPGGVTSSVRRIELALDQHRSAIAQIARRLPDDKV